MTTATAHEASRRLRSERARQRRELRGAPPQELVRAIIHPSDDLASYRLSALFGAREGSGVIVGFGAYRLEHAMLRAGLTSDPRLRDLTEAQRRHFAAALLAEAPKGWVRGG
jgi:hypothetical protein